VSWPPDVGEIVPNAHDAFGVHEKLTSYSLNVDHRDGADKARVFRSVLGLTASDVEYLARALVEGLASTPVRRVRENPPHGVLCDVWITVYGLGARTDRTAVVRTAWEIRREDDAPRLITAYIRA
jgi:hypothetical protein